MKPTQTDEILAALAAVRMPAQPGEYDIHAAVARALAAGRASMCQDMERGRRTEIDFINGAVVRLGRKYGVPTPRHELIVNLIHTKETL